MAASTGLHCLRVLIKDTRSIANVISGFDANCEGMLRHCWRLLRDVLWFPRPGVMHKRHLVSFFVLETVVGFWDFEGLKNAFQSG